MIPAFVFHGIIVRQLADLFMGSTAIKLLLQRRIKKYWNLEFIICYWGF
jgi:hypothetical protein